MPVKYRLKEYKRGGLYHIYNRGTDRREVFGESSDYEKFLEVLGSYVGRKRESADGRFKGDKPSVAARKGLMNLAGEIEVMAFCLMPDHFHLVVRQMTAAGMTKLMRRVNTAYVMYFNRKYGRHGPLFESVYRAVEVEESQLLALTKFLHLHPVARIARRFGLVMAVTAGRPEDYLYSSYRQYIGLDGNIWVNKGLLKLNSLDYQKYVNQPHDPKLEDPGGTIFD